MAASPQWKVFDSNGQYQAACKEPEGAAVLVTFYGEGATIRFGHKRILWTEGQDGNAADSYDDTALTLYERRDNH